MCPAFLILAPQPPQQAVSFSFSLGCSLLYSIRISLFTELKLYHIPCRKAGIQRGEIKTFYNLFHLEITVVGAGEIA